jgi:CHAT domain-containing protein
MRKVTNLPELLVCLSLAAWFGATAFGQQLLPSVVLEPNQPVARALTGASSHSYQLRLAAGEYARIEIEQSGSGFDVSLLTPGGERLEASPDVRPHVAVLSVVAVQAANYQIEIRQPDANALPINYRVQLVAQHAATPTQQAHWTALWLVQEGVDLYDRHERAALLQALEKWRQAAAVWSTLADHFNAGRMHEQIGLGWRVLGENRRAEEDYQQAIRLFRDAGLRGSEARCLNSLATMFASVGNYARATQFFNQAFQLWEKAPDPDYALAKMLQSGRVYRLAGEWQKAQELFTQLLKAARGEQWRSRRNFYERKALMELGFVAAGKRKWRQALDHFTLALPLMKASRERPDDVVYVLNQLGLVWQKLAEPAKALIQFEEGLQIARQLGNRRGQVLVLNSLGQYYTELGHSAEAANALTLARSLNSAMGNKPEEAATWLRFARLAQTQARFADACQYVEQALSSIEDMRTQIAHETLRASFLALQGEAYELYLDLLWRRHEREPQSEYDARALAVAEQFHARSLLESLAESGGQARPPLDAQLLVQQRWLNQQITTLHATRYATTVEKAQAANTLTRLLAEYDQVEFQIRQNSPPYSPLASVPLTLPEIQASVLDSQTLLLEYVLGAQQSYLFVASSTALHSFVLPNRSELEQQARRLHELFSAFSQPPAFKSVAEKLTWQTQQEQAQLAAATALSQAILLPAGKLIKGKRLLIVPDGALHYVPFAALPELGVVDLVLGAEKKQRHSLVPSPQPLIVGHEILTLPSASLLAVLRKLRTQRPPAALLLAVLADPVFSQRDARLLLTTGPELSSSPPAANVLRSLTNGLEPERLERLPASRQEAQSIAALVPPAQRRLWLDFDASMTAATSPELRQYRYLHFATHGLLNSDYPELSGLAFSFWDAQGVAQAGFLTALEIYKLQLNAELVVLSGCRTALGKEIGGEGVVGLTRGFLYAGARRVLSSTWAVNDAATAELMKRFYSHLLGHKLATRSEVGTLPLTPAAALREAQLSMWRDKRWHAPYYWAAFALQGEW